jgi:hypothetical protein
VTQGLVTVLQPDEEERGIDGTLPCATIELSLALLQ